MTRRPSWIDIGVWRGVVCHWAALREIQHGHESDDDTDNCWNFLSRRAICIHVAFVMPNAPPE